MTLLEERVIEHARAITVENLLRVLRDEEWRKVKRTTARRAVDPGLSRCGECGDWRLDSADPCRVCARLDVAVDPK